MRIVRHDLARRRAADYDRNMPTILLYFFLAAIVIGGVILAVPDDEPETPPPNPLEVMRELKQ